MTVKHKHVWRQQGRLFGPREPHDDPNLVWRKATFRCSVPDCDKERVGKTTELAPKGAATINALRRVSVDNKIIVPRKLMKPLQG